MKTRGRGSRIVAVLILNLGVDDQHHAPTTLHPVKGPRCQLWRRVCEAHGPSGQVWRREIIFKNTN